MIFGRNEEERKAARPRRTFQGLNRCFSFRKAAARVKVGKTALYAALQGKNNHGAGCLKDFLFLYCSRKPDNPCTFVSSPLLGVFPTS